MEAISERQPVLPTIIVFAAFLSSLIISLAPCTLRAQSWNSHLEGLVTDPSGAVIPGAQVELKNAATSQVRQTATDAQGFYTFPLMPVGSYDLKVSAPGFADRVLHGLTLQVGQMSRLDLTLQLSRGQAVVQVDARPPLVETASPAIGDEISNQRVTSLPLNGRQFSQLALLAAGAVPPYPNGSSQQFNTPALGLGFSVNGQRSERNNFSLDGVTLMEPFAYSLTVNPSVDAIREFRVVEDSYSAEQGIASGAQVNIATRSGANRFSGTAYEFLRNSALDAKNFFDDPDRKIPPYRQNQFGASLGGPVRRDRTFFFTNYEGLRIRQSLTNTTLLPTAAMRQGDFSGANPLTRQPFPAILNPATGQQFDGNQIPQSALDPLSVAVLAREPLPNQPNAAVGTNNTLNVGLRQREHGSVTGAPRSSVESPPSAFWAVPVVQQRATLSFRARQLRAEPFRAAGIWHQARRHGKEPRARADFSFSPYAHQRLPLRIRVLLRHEGVAEYSQWLSRVPGHHARCRHDQ